MEITFGDDAGEAFINMVDRIPGGYIVALLPEGKDLPAGELDPAVDVSLVGADSEGVHYRQINTLGEVIDRRTILVRPWENVARIHIY